MASRVSGPPSWNNTTPTRRFVRAIRSSTPQCGRDDIQNVCCSSNGAVENVLWKAALDAAFEGAWILLRRVSVSVSVSDVLNTVFLKLKPKLKLSSRLV